MNLQGRVIGVKQRPRHKFGETRSSQTCSPDCPDDENQVTSLAPAEFPQRRRKVGNRRLSTS
jgi:hypothetical protein